MGLIKVAIVDDELTSRNTIKKYLEHNQVYEVAADFPNGKSALEWLRKNSVDILLCDIQMPDMNGVELMRHVHIIYEYLPIVAEARADRETTGGGIGSGQGKIPDYSCGKTGLP